MDKAKAFALARMSFSVNLPVPNIYVARVTIHEVVVNPAKHQDNSHYKVVPYLKKQI
jgi:hypothetical protein